MAPSVDQGEELGLHGRIAAPREEGTLELLAPGARRHFSLELQVLTGSREMQQVEGEIAAARR